MYLLGNFNCFCWHLLTFYKINFLRVSKQFRSRSDPTKVGPNLGTNCLQKLSEKTSVKLNASKKLNILTGQNHKIAIHHLEDQCRQTNFQTHAEFL